MPVFKLSVGIEGADSLTPAIQNAERALEEAADNMGESLEDLQDDLDETGDTAKTMGSTLGNFLKNPMVAASAAIGGAGLAFNAFTDSTRIGSQAVGVAAINTGLMRDEVVSMAKEVSNSTLRAQDAARGFQLLSTFGVKSREDLIAITQAADTLSTAVGGDVVESIRTLRTAAFAMGVDVKTASENMDALGAIGVKLGAEGIDRFARNVSQLRPTLEKTGLSVDDFATFMLALGSTGGELSELLPKLRVQLQGLGDEGADVADVYRAVEKEFGFTEKQMADFRVEVQNGTQAINNQAIEMARHLGPVSDLKSAIDDLKFQFGDALAPVADFGDVMLGLAGTLFSLSIIMPVVQAAVIAMLVPLAAFLGITVLLAGLIIVLIGAFVLLAAALIFNWGDIRGFWKEFFLDLLKVRETIADIKDSFTNLPFTKGGLFGPNKDHNFEGRLRVTDLTRMNEGPNAGSGAEFFGRGGGRDPGGNTFIFQDQVDMSNIDELAERLAGAATGVPTVN